MLSRTLLILSLILALSGAASASAIYTDLSSFLGAVQPGYYLENFNTVDTTVYPPTRDFSESG
jgi:hypothetical protein